ncbi:hypothetical protein ACFLYR_00545 [Chloroflexota bacterium]
MIFDTNNCVGCRTCEIACSYHRRGVFTPGISSIQVIDRPKEQAFAISLYQQNDSGHIAYEDSKGMRPPLPSDAPSFEDPAENH